MTVALAAVAVTDHTADGAVVDGQHELALLRPMVSAEFWSGAGWDPHRRLVRPVPSHPVLGWPCCPAKGCRVRSRGTRSLCGGCQTRWRASGIGWDEFVATPRPRDSATAKRRLFDEPCTVPGCPRPQQTMINGLCGRHRAQAQERFRAVTPATVARLLRLPEVGPLSSFGDCVVAACTRLAEGNSGLCLSHTFRWRKQQRNGHTGGSSGGRSGDRGDIDFAAWCRIEPGIACSGMVNLCGLPELIVIEMLVGVQRRAEQGFKVSPDSWERVVRHVRRQQCDSVAEATAGPLRGDTGLLLGHLQRECRRARTSWEAEQTRDVWDLGVAGLPGRLDFTDISQPWLRAATKAWVAEDLPQRRGPKPGHVQREHINAVAELSRSLRLLREDHGNDPSALDRGDVLAFLTRLAHREHTDQISAHQRVGTVRRARAVLRDGREAGLARPGGCLAGLPGPFALRRSDIPAAPAQRSWRALPAEVMRRLDAALPQLEQQTRPEFRVAVELLMDTGRRPDEICRLPWACLDRDADGHPVLLYTDFKRNRLGRRLPIPASTAELIRAQQQVVRRRFPDLPEADLVLLPATMGCAHGTTSIKAAVLTNVHRTWVDTLAPFTSNDDTPFPASDVVPYAYRHSYAQRHADAGTPMDVLRDLLGHRSTATTQIYYRVTEKRTRTAVDRLAQHQYDGTGRRLWREAAEVLDSERARRRIGQVAVPYGICTEPSNVQAGGGSCPYRFRCVGCGHYRTDVSYLPELRAYLDRLLADRERVLAATDLADWAKAETAPTTTEITKVRDLIRRLEVDLQTLPAEQRHHIDDACAVVRKTRRTVHLGMPSVPAPVVDVRDIGRTG